MTIGYSSQDSITWDFMRPRIDPYIKFSECDIAVLLHNPGLLLYTTDINSDRNATQWIATVTVNGLPFTAKNTTILGKYHSHMVMRWEHVAVT